MICDFIFTVNGKEITVQLETDSVIPTLDHSVYEALKKEPEKFRELVQQLRDTLYSKDTFKTVDYDTIVKEGVVSNYTSKDIAVKYPGIFPEGIEVDVLLVKNLKVAGKTIKERVISTDGREVFVVSDTEKDVKKLAYYLNFRKLLEKHPELIDPESPHYKELEIIRKARNERKKTSKVESIYEMFEEFMDSSDIYSKLYYKKDSDDLISAYTTLLKIKNEILEYNYSRKEWADPAVNEINIYMMYFSDGVKRLRIDHLYNVLKARKSEWIKELKLNLDNFKTELSKTITEENIETYRKVFSNAEVGQTGFQALWNTLIDLEPDYTLSLDSIGKNTLTFKAKPRTINAKYGLPYNTIVSLPIVNENYQDYKIYKWTVDGKDYYIPSRGYLVEESITTRFETLDEAKALIERSNLNQELSTHAFLEFKLRNSATNDEGVTIYEDELDKLYIKSKLYYTEKQVIESIDIPISLSFYNNPSILEQTLLKSEGQTLKDFYKFIDDHYTMSEANKALLKSILNSPEKAVTFIYKVNELLKDDRTDETKILEIANQIANAPKRCYFIESRRNLGNGMRYYRILPTDGIKFEDETTKSKLYPIIKFMIAVLNFMQSKFNIPMELVTSSEIANNPNKFKGVDPNTSKAFILDNVIYVNTTLAKSTDLLHEYVHLILGVLRSDKDLRSNYEQLMYAVVNTSEGKYEFDRLKRTYPDLSEISIMEEVFAKKFAEHLVGSLDSQLNLVFKLDSKFLEEASSKIFLQPVANLLKFYNKSLLSIFSRFETAVGLLLETPGLSFETDSLKLQNWISKLIKKYKSINENCL